MLVLTMRVCALLHHLDVLLKDPIYRNLYITHRPSTGIIVLYVTVTVLMFVMKASVSDMISLDIAVSFAFMFIVLLYCHFTTVNS